MNNRKHGDYQALVNAAEQIRALISDDHAGETLDYIHAGEMLDYIDSILEEALKECKIPEEE